MSRLASAVAAALWLAAWALGVRERGIAPDAGRAARRRTGPAVSAIVPARDEAAAIAPALASLLAQDYAPLEVIVVDDESHDATAAIAGGTIGADPRGRLIAGAPPPEGWIGKSWACHQGVAAASGDWLLFTDADVHHRPDALGRALGLALELGRGGVTLFPRIRCETPAERIVLPAAIALISAFVTPGPLVRSPRWPVAIAAGGFILIERRVYERAGGHAGIRGRMVDDVALAEAVKRAGHLLVPCGGADLIELRMYRGAADMWRGWTKNASFGIAGGPAKALAGAGAILALGLLPPAAAIAGTATGRIGLALVGALGWGAQAAVHRQAVGLAPAPAPLALAMPLGVAFLAAAAGRSAWDRLRGRGPTWRGRRYPAAR